MTVGITLTSINKAMDYVPFASTFTNLFHLFKKYSYTNPANKEKDFDNVKRNILYHYIDKKSILRCLFLLIPFLGNFFVGICDFKNRKKEIEQAAINDLDISLTVLDSPELSETDSE